MVIGQEDMRLQMRNRSDVGCLIVLMKIDVV